MWRTIRNHMSFRLCRLQGVLVANNSGFARGAQAPSVPAKPLCYRAAKRLFDIVFSLFAIVVGFVPILVLALVVAIDTKGAPVYTQVRVGRGGKAFRIYKLRTMVADSDEVHKYFSPDQLREWELEHKVTDDPRVTRLGAFLRATSIDEFPQFLNVLLGQISIIGPRAITFDELDFYGQDKELLLSVAPGITGLWQTGPRNLATYESGLRQQIELSYVRQACLRLDASIFFKTFVTLWKRTGK